MLAAVVASDSARLGTGGAYARIGPQTIPYVIAACLAGLGVWTVIEAWRGDFPEREQQELGPVLWIVGGLLAQLVLIKFTGFSIATAVLFAMTGARHGSGVAAAGTRCRIPHFTRRLVRVRPAAPADAASRP